MWLQIYIKTMFRPAGLAFSKQYFTNFNDISERALRLLCQLHGLMTIGIKILPIVKKIQPYLWQMLSDFLPKLKMDLGIP